MDTSYLLTVSEHEALPIAPCIFIFFLLPQLHFSLQGRPKEGLASPVPLLAWGQHTPRRLCYNDHSITEHQVERDLKDHLVQLFLGKARSGHSTLSS